MLAEQEGGVGRLTCNAPERRNAPSPERWRAAKLGLGYRYGGIKRPVDLIGPTFAKEIPFTARQLGAACCASRDRTEGRRAFT